MTYLSPYPAGVTPADIDDSYDCDEEEQEDDDYEGEDITDLAALMD